MRRNSSSARDIALRKYLGQTIKDDGLTLILSETFCSNQLSTQKSYKYLFSKALNDETLNSHNFVPYQRIGNKQIDKKTIRPKTSKGSRVTYRQTCQQMDKKYSQSQYISQEKEETETEQQSIKANIEIIVNRCSRGEGVMKKRAICSRFETDLDEQFLSLFAS